MFGFGVKVAVEKLRKIGDKWAAYKGKIVFG